MEQIIRNMIAKSQYYMNNSQPDEAYELIGFTKELINEMCTTINCPSNWRSIGEELAEYYDEDSWVYENLELWNYVD